MDAKNRNDHIIHHDDTPTAADEVGEAAGGISGVVAGAAIGSLGGPIGTIVGGIAGAVGGWWAGRAVAEAAQSYTIDDEDFYRSSYEHSDARLADRSYDQVRPAYQLGHFAGHNPDYAGRPFESVESDLRRGWDTTATTTHGEWDQVRGYARDAYNRSAATAGSTPRRADESTREQANEAANDADARLDDDAGLRLF